MRNPIAALAAIGVVAIAVGIFMTAAKKANAPPTDTVMAEKDKLLAAAVYKAKQELPKFIKALQDHPEGEFAINGRFDTPKGPEQIWIRVASYDKGIFAGVIASKPVNLDKTQGDPVEIKEADVSDWTYKVDGKTEGGFTSLVLNGRG